MKTELVVAIIAGIVALASAGGHNMEYYKELRIFRSKC